MSHITSASESTPTKHTAGLFDIRTIIGLLLAVYGVILTLMGLFADPALHKTGGVNANLWAGIVLFVAGAVFLLWAKLRPVIVDERRVARDREAQEHEHH